jgi:two-component system phosphate regulon sensor histidine kinase PhoR
MERTNRERRAWSRGEFDARLAALRQRVLDRVPSLAPASPWLLAIGLALLIYAAMQGGSPGLAAVALLSLAAGAAGGWPATPTRGLPQPMPAAQSGVEPSEALRPVLAAVPAPAPAPPLIWPSLIEGLTDPALVLDVRQHVVGANAAARRLLPIVQGRHVSHTSRSPELLEAIAAAAHTAAAVTCQARLLSTPDRVFTAQVSPLAGPPEPGAACLFVVVRDLTEQERLARLRADFVANASHELRTPLTALKGFVETLAGPARDDAPARDRFLGIMTQQADRMARLIDDLLSLSRIEMHEHVAPSGQADVSSIVADTLRALAPLAEASKIKLRNHLPSEAPVIVGDRDELAQVIQNLVQNGIKYGRSGGKVEITLEPGPGRIGIAVTDDGIGIAPEHLPRLTERFYRVSAKDSRERGGTGLGLAIVKHIVARHRGHLDVRSSLGDGSTFTVWLPAKG